MPQVKLAALVEMSVLMGMIAKAGSQKAEYVGAVKVAASECIGQSLVHRNATPAIELVNVVSKHHKATLVAYLEKFGALRWNKEEGKLRFNERKDGALWTEEYAKQVLAFDWESARKPQEVKSEFDVDVEFAKFLQRVNGAIKKKIKVTNHELAVTLNAAYAKYVVDHYEDGMVKAGPSGAPKQQERVEQIAATAAEAQPASKEQLDALQQKFAANAA